MKPAHDPRFRAGRVRTRSGLGSREAILVCVVVCLLIVVALASDGSPTGSGAGPVVGSTPRLSAVIGGILAIAVVVIAVAASLLLPLVFSGISRPRKRHPERFIEEPPRPRWWSSALALLLVTAVIVTPIAVLVWTGTLQGHPASPRALAGSSPSTVGDTEGGSGSSGTATHLDLLLLAVVCAVAVGALLVVVSRRHHTPPVQVPRTGPSDPTLPRASEDISVDADPRHAVIDAYVSMGRELTAVGLTRRPSQAPFEYLEEALGWPVPEPPARTLTELFEIARFSRHHVDASMSQRASDALDAVRRALHADGL